MAKINERGFVARYRVIFEERDAYLREFETRRKRFDEQLAHVAERRKQFEAEIKNEIGETEEKLAEVAPLSPNEVLDIPMRRAAYSDRMSAVMAKLSLLSYVAFEDDTRRSVLEVALRQGGLQLIGYWNVGDTDAFLAEAPNFIALVFRGTTTKKDRETDFAFGVSKVEVPGHAMEVMVHEGFYNAYRLVEPGVRACLRASDNSKPIYLAGHSLGGALALVASAALSGADTLGERIAAVYTFGAPRVGGDGFERVVKAPHYRVVNEGDIVPLVPPNWVLGYRHTGEFMMLCNGEVHPVRRRSWVNTALLAIGGVLAWPFSRQLLFARRHAISLYASRLEVIARERGRWS